MGSQRVGHNWATGLNWTIVVQSLSCVQLFATPWIAAHQASLSTISWSLFKVVSLVSMTPSNLLILCRPFSSCIQSFPASEFFPMSWLCIRWPKYWSFIISISPSKGCSGLISFRMDCFDLFAVQGTRKNLLQHHSPKASILWHSPFFMVWLSHPYMTTRKTVTLTRQTFVGKVMYLLFNTLTWLVKAFLPRS